MARIAVVAGVGLALGLIGLGCSHLLEARTVNQFAQALEKKNISLAKGESTEDFNRKALRHTRALEDFEVLHLPTGKASVVKVEDESPTVKKVKVEVGKKKQKLLYKLVKDEKSGKWLVDDISVQQRRRGATVTEPVTRQMDLLLTVREFLDAWDGGGRTKILNIVTPELARELRDLPEPALKQVAKQVVGKRSTNRKLKPKAEIDREAAIVSLPRTDGKMILALRFRNEKWRVADVSVESRRDKSHLPSLLKKAVVMRTAHGFLAAYASGDRRQLQRLSTQRFYGESLAHTDLSLMPLQTAEEARAEFEVTLEKTRASYLVKEPSRWVRISLIPQDKKADANSPTEFLVEDVAVHKLGNKQEIRLSTFFTGRAKARLFAAALARRNVAVLSKLSTGDFRRSVWDEIESGMERQLPLPGLDDPRLTFDGVDFDGAVTEMHGRQGTQDVTYVLRERQGQVHVDDVRVLRFGKPSSVKGSLVLAIPILKFAAAMNRADIRGLQRVSSEDFNRLIWRQARAVPPSGKVVPPYLEGVISSVVRSGDETYVTVGDSQRGAKVKLVSENARYVIDEIVLIAGPLPSQQAKLKQQLRTEMANSAMITSLDPRAGRKNVTVIRPGVGASPSRSSRRPSSTKNPGMNEDLDSLLSMPLNASGRLPDPRRSKSAVRQVSARIDPRTSAAPADRRIVDVDVDPHGDAFDAQPPRTSGIHAPRRVIRTSDTDPILPRYQLR